MKQPVKIAFEYRGIMIPIDKILPLKKVKPQTKKTRLPAHEPAFKQHRIIC